MSPTQSKQKSYVSFFSNNKSESILKTVTLSSLTWNVKVADLCSTVLSLFQVSVKRLFIQQRVKQLEAVKRIRTLAGEKRQNLMIATAAESIFKVSINFSHTLVESWNHKFPLDAKNSVDLVMDQFGT